MGTQCDKVSKESKAGSTYDGVGTIDPARTGVQEESPAAV